MQLLRSAYDAFGDVLSKMRDKMEFGLKVSGIATRRQGYRGRRRRNSSLKTNRTAEGFDYFAACNTPRDRRRAPVPLERLEPKSSTASETSPSPRINKPIGDKMIMMGLSRARDQESRSIPESIDRGRARQVTFKYPARGLHTIRQHQAETGTCLMSCSIVSSLTGSTSSSTSCDDRRQEINDRTPARALLEAR